MADDNKADNNNPDAGGTNNQTDTGNKDGKSGTRKLEFTEEQQAFIQLHGDTLYGRGFNKAKTEADDQIKTLNQKITDLSSEIDTLKKSAKPGDKKDDTNVQQPANDEVVTQLRAKVEELQTAVNKYKTDFESASTRISEFEKDREQGIKKSEFYKSIPTGIAFFDSESVFEKLAPEIRKTDKGEWAPVNPTTGLPRLKADMVTPMTLADLIADYASKRSWEVKSTDTNDGADSGTSRRQAVEDGKTDYSKMSDADFAKVVSQVKAKG